MVLRWRIAKIFLCVLLVGTLIGFGYRAPVRELRNAIFRLLKPLASTANRSREKTIPVIPGDDRDQTIRALQFELEELRDENARLNQALEFKSPSGATLKGARVILYTRETGQESLLIDQGEQDGIQVGDLAVNSQQILVGKIQEIHSTYSKVSVASNAGTTWEVELKPLAIPVLAEGIGGSTFLLRLIPQNTPIRKGDFIAARNSQRSTPFLVGEVITLPVGTASAFQEARAIALVRPETLTEVFVVSRTP